MYGKNDESKVDQKILFFFLNLNPPNQNFFYFLLRIEEIILSYNILIELYVMINKFSFIL